MVMGQFPFLWFQSVGPRMAKLGLDFKYFRYLSAQTVFPKAILEGLGEFKELFLDIVITTSTVYMERVTVSSLTFS